MEKKIRYRLYTEYVHTRHVAEIVSKYFADYSMFSGIGHYNGDKERCLVIEIISLREYDEKNVISICQEINTVNDQTCCLVTSEQIDVMIITERIPV